MKHIVYFADKSLCFATAAPDASWHAVCVDRCGLLRDKILKNLESYKLVAVISSDPEASYAAFAAEFTAVVAGGGIVRDTAGRWLLIHRNGRWDLPKGHLEAGETIEQCAEREICEETGVAAEVVRPLCVTQHAYFFPPTQRWELKTTHWFELKTAACGVLTPQTEEGIEEVVWCEPTALDAILESAFPTIRAVAAAMQGR